MSNKKTAHSRKREELSSIQAKLRSHDSISDYQTLSQTAANLIAPSEAEPIVFPGLGRRGVSKFRIVHNVDAGTQFGLRARPDIDQPLSVTSPVLQPFGDRRVLATSWVKIDDSANVNMDMGGQNCANYTVLARSVGGFQSLPLATAATLNITLKLASLANAPFSVALLAYDGATWVTPTLWADQEIGGAEGPKTITVTWLATYTDYRWVVSQVSGNAVAFSSFIGEFAGTLISCAPIVEDCSMIDLFPQWNALKAASEAMSIVSMDVLVTYQGSSLNDNGAIAGAYVEDETIEFGTNMYDTLALRPFDRYEGRLAPKGGEEGGAHIHYVPSDLAQLLLGNNGLKELPNMYVAVKGKTGGESVRIDCTIIVNYYSIDPSYNMSISPPISGFVSLLSHLRHEIPMVTSNDGHEKKMKRLLKKGGKFLDLSRAGFAKANDIAPEVIRLITLISTLV
jgi:hypothetical protein